MPDLRASIRRDGIVRAVCWSPNLELCGPSATLLEGVERAGVTLVDVTFVREGGDGPVMEAIVEFVCGGGEVACEVLAGWAALVGMSRVWFASDVRELEPVASGKVAARCSGCRVRLVDGQSAFWEWVRHVGHFPTACPLCGADVPQWQPVRPRPGRRSATPDRAGAADRERKDLQLSDRHGGERP